MPLMNYYMGTGVGEGATLLNSFDDALLKAGIGNYNLIKISSILPAKCKQQKSITVEEGMILYTAYASIASDVENTCVSAAISVGIPEDNEKVGVIMEYSGFVEKEIAFMQVEKMVNDAMLNRRCEKYDIKTVSCEGKVGSKGIITAFAGIAIW